LLPHSYDSRIFDLNKDIIGHHPSDYIGQPVQVFVRRETAKNEYGRQMYSSDYDSRCVGEKVAPNIQEPDGGLEGTKVLDASKKIGHMYWLVFDVNMVTVYKDDTYGACPHSY
jgi:hypothetical protein